MTLLLLFGAGGAGTVSTIVWKMPAVSFVATPEALGFTRTMPAISFLTTVEDLDFTAVVPAISFVDIMPPIDNTPAS